MSNTVSQHRPISQPLLILTIVSVVLAFLSVAFTGSTVLKRLRHTSEINAVLSENRALEREVDVAKRTFAEERGIDPSLIEEEGSAEALAWCEESGLGIIPFGLDAQVEATLNRPAAADEFCPTKTTLMDGYISAGTELLDNVDIKCTSNGSSTTITGTLRYDSDPSFPDGVPTGALDIDFLLAATQNEVAVSEVKESVEGLQPGESRPFSVTIDHPGKDPDGCRIRMNTWWPTGYISK